MSQPSYQTLPRGSIPVITTIKAAEKVIRKIAKSGVIHALDFETTGLDFEKDRCTVVSLAGPAWSGVIHLERLGGFKALAPIIGPLRWWVFYAGFEGRWFLKDGITVPLCLDVGNMRRAILGGGHFNLVNLCKWDLKEDLDKTQQLSDWSKKTLDEDQIWYAYKDADVTYRLAVYYLMQSTPGVVKGFNLLNHMLSAVIEMEDGGIKLDRKKHQALIALWQRRKETSYKALRRLVSADQIPNLRSNIQIGAFLETILPDETIAQWPKTEKAGQLDMSRDVLKDICWAMRGYYPLTRLLAGLMVYSRASHLLSSFGDNLLQKSAASRDGRIRAKLYAGGAKTCRFTASAPNMTAMPADRTVRGSFVAGLGRRLVVADYKSIEVRVLAVLTGDPLLTEDCVYGDVHREVAASNLGIPSVEVTPGQRKRAKGTTFGILYGSAAYGLATKAKITEAQAQGQIDSWAKRYPKAYGNRFTAQAEAIRTGRLTMASGRTVYVGKNASLPICANYPIQGSAADVINGALTRLKELLDDAREDGTLNPKMTQLCLIVHDELVVECHKTQVDIVKPLVVEAMTWGWLNIFPNTSTDNLIDIGDGPSWGEAKP